MKLFLNKNILLTAAAIISVCIFSFSLATNEKENKGTSTPVAEKMKSEEINTNTAVVYDYIIKAHEGKIAVFLRGTAQPEMIFDVYIHHLPEMDRLQLEKGVPIKDYATLVETIEDYIS